jgi:hypothetical protein
LAVTATHRQHRDNGPQWYTSTYKGPQKYKTRRDQMSIAVSAQHEFLTLDDDHTENFLKDFLNKFKVIT